MNFKEFFGRWGFPWGGYMITHTKVPMGAMYDQSFKKLLEIYRKVAFMYADQT